MKVITTKELIPYLKTAIDLESSVNAQESAINSAKHQLEMRTPNKSTPVKPTKSEARPPYRKPDPEFPGTATFCLILGIIVLAFEINAKLNWKMEGSYLDVLMIGLGGFCLFAYLSNLSNYKSIKSSNEREYEKAYQKYSNEVKGNEISFENAMKKYDEDCKLAEKDYQHQLKLYEDTKTVVSSLEAPLYETKKTLENLYQFDFIFPKYQNLVALSSIYEYFLTGRCTELTGPNGAYNLYESELRQNLIISNLEAILSELSSIKNNQYILYKALEKTQKIVSGIATDIDGIYAETIDVSRQVSNATHFAALRAESLEKNTEAIKYISLLNAAK